MSERRLGNFNSCCRLCLSEKLGTLKSIFEDESRGQEIAKNIKTSLGVQVSFILIFCSQFYRNILFYSPFLRPLAASLSDRHEVANNY